MTDQHDPKFIYDRLRSLLGGTLPVGNFNAAKVLVEGSGSAYRDQFAAAIGAVHGAAIQKLSTGGKALLKRLEGLRTKAYLDTAGIPTIGYGNTYHPNGVKVKLGDTITVAQADAYLDAIVPTYENAVRKIITTPITQRQYDALVCFVYNIGSTQFLNSSVDDKLNAGDFDAALKTWAAYNKVRNPKTGELEVSAGLVNRRTAEINYFKGV